MKVVGTGHTGGTNTGMGDDLLGIVGQNLVGESVSNVLSNTNKATMGFQTVRRKPIIVNWVVNGLPKNRNSAKD